MASEKFLHAQPGLNLVPNSTTQVAVVGDIDYSTDTGKFNILDASGASTLFGATTTVTLTNKTLVIGSNHITGTLGRAAQFNASTGDLEVSAVTATELGYVSGVTSAIQTQLNSKLTSFSIGSLDSQSANAQGLAFTGSVLSAQSADTTHPGLVNNTTQSFSGNKTFTGTIGASNLSGTNTGDQTITLTGDITGSGTGSFATTYNGTVPLNKGGTGQITANASFNTLVPSQTSNSGKFLTTDGTNTSWASVGAASNPQIAYVSDQKAQGTSGGTATSGSWLARDLNTLTTVNSPSWITANGTDNFTLTAGSYDIYAISPYSFTNRTQTKLYNTTDSTDAILGSSIYASTGIASGVFTGSSVVVGSIVIAGTKTFQLQYQCQATSATNGLGQFANFTTEVYSMIKITKIA